MNLQKIREEQTETIARLEDEIKAWKEKYRKAVQELTDLQDQLLY